MLIQPEDYTFYAEIDLFVAQDKEGAWYAFSPTFGIMVKQNDSWTALEHFWKTVLSRNTTPEQEHDEHDDRSARA